MTRVAWKFSGGREAAAFSRWAEAAADAKRTRVAMARVLAKVISAARGDRVREVARREPRGARGKAEEAAEESAERGGG